jgi:hypothetical protein
MLGSRAHQILMWYSKYAYASLHDTLIIHFVRNDTARKWLVALYSASIGLPTALKWHLGGPVSNKPRKLRFLTAESVF